MNALVAILASLVLAACVWYVLRSRPDPDVTPPGSDTERPDKGEQP